MAKEPAPDDDTTLPPGILGEDPEGQDLRGLVIISLVAALAGLVVGIVGGYFRKLLIDGDDLRGSFLDWAHRLPGPGWLVPIVVVIALVLAARLLVVLVPRSSGSGIQDVEAVWREEMPATSWKVIPAKFVGGLLAIGGGLALGREGPTVHLGAAIGAVVGQWFRLSDSDVRVLQTSLGGAGLGVAFNAPLGGAMFVFEEVAKSIRLRLGLVTLIGTSTAIATSRVILGNHPDFLVSPIPSPDGWTVAVFVVFGVATGFVGVAYNRLITGFLAVSDRAAKLSPFLQAGVVATVVGVLLWIDPLVATGGGDQLTQKLLGGGVAVAAVGWYLVARFVLGPASYSAQTAGGLFSPLLAVGALWGALAFEVADQFLSGPGLSVTAFALVGMATLFAVVVRAPFTGILLIIEMTAVTTLVVPMLAAAFAATLTAALLRNPPIYDSLRGRMLAAGRRA